MKKLQTVLQEIGLNACEAEVYLRCLKIGTQDIKTLAKDLGYSLSQVSNALAHLHTRGLVSKFSSRKDYYTAEHPEIIQKFLQEEEAQLLKKIERFNSVLPSFKDFVNPAFVKPEIAFYEGHDGLIAAYEDTLTSTTDILAITSIDDSETALDTYTLKYYKRRKAAGILIKAIFADTPKSRQRQKQDHEEMRISRLVPSDLIDYHIEMNIYDSRVAYFSFKESLAIIVHSEVISSSMRQVFNMCWNMAEQYEKNRRGT